MLLARMLIVLCMVALSGCFGAYTMPRDFCTSDPKDTTIRACTAKEMKASTDWQNKISKGMQR
jgi:hypothetical protein